MPAYRAGIAFLVTTCVLVFFLMFVPLFISAQENVYDTASQREATKVTNDCIACLALRNGKSIPVGLSCKVTGGGSNTKADCTCTPDVFTKKGTCETKYCVGGKCFDAQTSKKPVDGEKIPQNVQELNTFREGFIRQGTPVSPITDSGVTSQQIFGGAEPNTTQSQTQHLFTERKLNCIEKLQVRTHTLLLPNQTLTPEVEYRQY